MKKMKKRRELDALVNGKLGRRKKGQHELLRNETDSSEVEEFSIPEKTVMRKSNTCRFCTTCITVCGFFMLVTCVAAIAGLVWVHIELKKEVDVLRAQLSQVQLNAPQSLQQIANKQQMLENTVHHLQDVSITGNQLNISQLFSQISAVNRSLNGVLKQLSADSGPQLDSKQLVQNIATLGSTLHSLQTDMSKLMPLQDMVSSQGDKIRVIDSLIDSLNHSLNQHYHDNMLALSHVLNMTESLELRFGLLEVKPGVSVAPNTEEVIHNVIHDSLEQLLKNITLPGSQQDNIAFKQLQDGLGSLRERIELVNETLRNDIQQTAKDQMFTTVRFDERIAALSENFSSFQSETSNKISELNRSISVLFGYVNTAGIIQPVTTKHSSGNNIQIEGKTTASSATTTTLAATTSKSVNADLTTAAEFKAIP